MNIRPAIFVFAVGLAALVGSTWLIGVDGPPAERRARDAAVPHVFVRAEPASVADESGPSESPVLEPVRGSDWTRRFHESTDDFLLAREMGAAALAGDAAAQERLGRLLLRCEVYKRILAPYTEGTVAERVEFHLASGKFSEQGRSLFRREALRCGRLFSDDPFADYDLPEEAGDFRYWSRLAVESGDPLAVIDRAFRSAVEHTRSDDAEKERAFREGLLSDVRRVVFAGDAAALYVLGGVFSHPSIAAEPEDGYAWIVAACESGYDCSNANPDVGSGCVERGMCEPGHTFLDVLQRDLGAGKYGAIYAHAQDIRYKLDTNDWDGLQQYLQVKE